MTNKIAKAQDTDTTIKSQTKQQLNEILRQQSNPQT